MAKTTFVLLSFEGPDQYSHAGGIGSRVDELSRTLAGRGLETHLFFIGDPALPGYDVQEQGQLHLHRWCQWISGYHLGGVYEGEEDKLRDWQDSLPAWLAGEFLASRVAAGESIVVLAEEWQTAETVTRLRRLVENAGWQDSVSILWNANNTFSFDRIDWASLDAAATVTTVSRYMKREMWAREGDPRVIPNGIEDAWLLPAPASAVNALRRLFSRRLSILKVGRFDPNKRWLAAIEAVALLKDAGRRPLLIARGGNEGHGKEVFSLCDELGLTISRCAWSPDEGLTSALASHIEADVVFLEGNIGFGDRKALYQACNAVLANSAIEPFGLVGLEAMACGGLVLVGCTGEDYSLSGHDSISLQTSRPDEIVHHLLTLAADRELATRMRKAARVSAGRFTWSAVLNRTLFPLLREMGLTLDLQDPQRPSAPPRRPSRRKLAAPSAPVPHESPAPREVVEVRRTAPEYLFTAATSHLVAPPTVPA